MVEVATPSEVCFLLIYIFFEVMLMSGIDEIRGCLEDYILLFLFDVCIFLHINNKYSLENVTSGVTLMFLRARVLVLLSVSIVLHVVSIVLLA